MIPLRNSTKRRCRPSGGVHNTNARLVACETQGVACASRTCGRVVRFRRRHVLDRRLEHIARVTWGPFVRKLLRRVRPQVVVHPADAAMPRQRHHARTQDTTKSQQHQPAAPRSLARGSAPGKRPRGNATHVPTTRTRFVHSRGVGRKRASSGRSHSTALAGAHQEHSTG